MFKATGRLKYSPKRIGDEKYGPDNWWLVLELLSDSLGDYYRHLYYLHTNKTQRLKSFSWIEHVTIIRGHVEGRLIQYGDLWKLHQDSEYLFEYIPNFTDYRGHITMPVKFDSGAKIRSELGLNPLPTVDYHLTIGTY